MGTWALLFVYSSNGGEYATGGHIGCVSCVRFDSGIGTADNAIRIVQIGDIVTYCTCATCEP